MTVIVSKQGRRSVKGEGGQRWWKLFKVEIPGVNGDDDDDDDEQPPLQHLW